MKIDFLKVIFTDESLETFDDPDGWISKWFVRVVKRKQQGGGSVITIIAPFKFNEDVKLKFRIYG